MENKNRKTVKPRQWMIFMLLVAAVLAVVLLLPFQKSDEPSETTEEALVSAEVTMDTMPEAYMLAQLEASMFPMELGDGLRITNISHYAGPYLEDGSDALVTGILMLELENIGEKDLQLANIKLNYGDREALFTVTNLPAGGRLVALEQNRMASTGEAPLSVKAENVVLLDKFEKYEDLLEITVMDAAINVRNCTNADLEGDIFIYYKNLQGGVYYGGITYRVRLEGGLKAGEVRQIMAAHFDSDGSEILMVSRVAP